MRQNYTFYEYDYGEDVEKPHIFNYISESTDDILNSRSFQNRLNSEDKVFAFTFKQMLSAIEYRLSYVRPNVHMLINTDDSDHEKIIVTNVLNNILSEGLSKYVTSTQCFIAQEMHAFKIISKPTLKQIFKSDLSKYVNELNATDSAINNINQLDFPFDLYTLIPTYIQFLKKYDLKKLHTEMDSLLDSNIFKIYPNGALAINTEAEIDCDKLKDVPDAFKIKIWKLSRGMSLSKSQAKKINGLIDNLTENSPYFNTNEYMLLLGSWTKNPELKDLDIECVNKHLTLSKFKNICSSVLPRIDLKGDTEAPLLVAIKDKLDKDIEPVNEWIGKNMLDYLVRGLLVKANIFNLPYANYNDDTIKFAFEYTEKEDNQTKLFIPERVMFQFESVRKTIELTGLSWFSAMKTHLNDLEHSENVPMELVNDLLM